MVNLISDLDSTLIYSKMPQHVPVEFYEGRPITYVTHKSLKILYNLFENKNFQLIPCTLRSREQTMRIKFLQEHFPKYMICDNGASLYINGELDADYQNFLLAEKLIEHPFVGDMKECLEKNTAAYVKDNKMSFLTVIFSCHQIAEQQFDYVAGLVQKYPVKTERQGRKIYIIPHGLGKEIAVNYLKEHLGLELTFTSGDGFVDEAFVKMGDTPLVPSHAVFQYEKKLKSSGIVAGEAILKIVENAVGKII